MQDFFQSTHRSPRAPVGNADRRRSTTDCSASIELLSRSRDGVPRLGLLRAGAGDIRFVSPARSVPIILPRNSSAACDGVGVVALEVPDAAAAFHETTTRAPSPNAAVGINDGKACIPLPLHSPVRDTLIKFVERDDYVGTFAPGISRSQARRRAPACSRRSPKSSAMSNWARWRRGSGSSRNDGIQPAIHFDDKTITTEYRP